MIINLEPFTYQVQCTNVGSLRCIVDADYLDSVSVEHCKAGTTMNLQVHKVYLNMIPHSSTT